MKNISGKIIIIILVLFWIAVTIITAIAIIEPFTTEEIETVEFTTVLNHMDKDIYTESGGSMGTREPITVYTVAFKDDENNYVEEEISKKQYAKYHEGDKVKVKKITTQSKIFKWQNTKYVIKGKK